MSLLLSNAGFVVLWSVIRRDLLGTQSDGFDDGTITELGRGRVRFSEVFSLHRLPISSSAHRLSLLCVLVATVSSDLVSILRFLETAKLASDCIFFIDGLGAVFRL